MNDLYKFIVENYKKLSSSEVLDISQQQCNNLMIMTNNLLQRNINVWSDSIIKEYSNRIQYYAEINTFITNTKRGENEPYYRKNALDKINYLVETIQKETETIFLDADMAKRQNIIEEIYVPHLLLKYTILNI